MNAPAISLDGTGILAIGALVVAGGVGLWAYKKRQAIADALNPTKDTNLASRASSALVQQLTGGAAAGGEDSLGGVFARIREKVSGVDFSAPVKPAVAERANDLAEYYGL